MPLSLHASSPFFQPALSPLPQTHLTSDFFISLLPTCFLPTATASSHIRFINLTKPSSTSESMRQTSTAPAFASINADLFQHSFFSGNLINATAKRSTNKGKREITAGTIAGRTIENVGAGWAMTDKGKRLEFSIFKAAYLDNFDGLFGLIFGAKIAAKIAHKCKEQYVRWKIENVDCKFALHFEARKDNSSYLSLLRSCPSFGRPEPGNWPPPSLSSIIRAYDWVIVAIVASDWLLLVAVNSSAKLNTVIYDLVFQEAMLSFDLIGLLALGMRNASSPAGVFVVFLHSSTSGDLQCSETRELFRLQVMHLDFWLPVCLKCEQQWSGTNNEITDASVDQNSIGLPPFRRNASLPNDFATGATRRGAGLIDTVRRRLMMTSGEPVKYKNDFDAFSQIVKKEGLKALFKGGAANIIRSAAGAGVLAGYDELQLIVYRKKWSGGS
ncbi:hypothetical protein M8C21_003732, partial [Ambrosia artemisiifolia]